MSKTFTEVAEYSSVILPREALDALGVNVGAELEIEIVGRALITRSLEEARRSGNSSALSMRQSAYDALAGADREARIS